MTMDHREASLLLDDLAGDRLDAVRRRQVESHLADCPECQRWCDVYSLVAEGFGAGSEGWPAEHPDSAALAAFAVDPQGLRDHGELEQHLEHCRECNSELDLTCQAISAARQEQLERRVDSGAARFSWVSQTGLAAAASLALVIATGVFFSLVSGGGEPPVHRVSGSAFEGVEIIEGHRSLLVDETALLAGSDVTVRAGDVVALGDGFSVAGGANLTVEVRSAGVQPTDGT